MKPSRISAAVLSAFILLLPLSVSPALAQMQHAQTVHGRPPAAAPVGGHAQQGELAPPNAAPTGAVDTTVVGDQTNETEQTFSPVGLFMRAGPVVKGVLLLLLACSFWSWVIIIDKWLSYGTLTSKANKFEQNFWSGRSLDDLYSQYSSRADHPMAALFVAGLREWKRSFEHGVPAATGISGVKERVAKAMNVSIQRDVDKAERGLGFLATVGSTAPFVGLFGTVWGIMSSFRAIAAQHDTTLAVVAPGIAEALFATALGLLAAIPAVVAYNRFVNELGRYNGRLEGFADEFSAFLSRQLDERAR